MSLARTTALLVALATLAAQPSIAQVAGALDVGSGIGQFGSGAWMRESRLAPSLRAANRSGFLQFDATAAERAGSLALRRSAVDGALSSPPFGVFRVLLSGHYSHDASAVGGPRTGYDASSLLSAKLGAGGVWVGATRARQAGPILNAGAWRVLGPAILSIATTNSEVRIAGRPSTFREVTVMDSLWTDSLGRWSYFPVTRIFGDSGTASRFQRWSDLEARVDWTVGRLALTAAVSGRAAMDSLPARMWGRVNAALQLNSRVALVAAGGTLPAIRGITAPTASFVSLGIKVSPAALLRPPLPAAIRPAPSAFVVENVDSGAYRVTLRVPGARTVDLSGDFNRWQPVPLRETRPGVWEAVLALTAGTHRMSVRVDGDAWDAPPGVPTVSDEFNGRVGIVVVR